MKRTIFSLAAALVLLGGAAPLRAATVTQCIIQAVKDCDAMFPPSDRFLIAIRGWCYIIHTAICKSGAA